jgi:clan AA aspartic protease
MGLTKVTSKISPFSNGKKFYEAVFLVDTGVTDSMVPAPEIEKVGVKKEGKMSYELANGQVKEYPYGLVRIEFMGETTVGRVIFGESECEPLLGITVLESVGIVIDSVNKTPKRVPAFALN